MRGRRNSSRMKRSMHAEHWPWPRVAGECWFSYRQGTSREPGKLREPRTLNLRSGHTESWGHFPWHPQKPAPPQQPHRASVVTCGPRECRRSRTRGQGLAGLTEEKTEAQRDPTHSWASPKPMSFHCRNSSLQESLPPLDTASLPPLPSVCRAGSLCCGLD